MAVIHDYECAKHGVFEASHPICPHLGCDSVKVKMVFLKAPGMLSGKTKQFDKGVRGTADQYGLDYLRSTKEGESSYGGHAAGGMLWGQAAAAAFGGLDGMVNAASSGIAESNAIAAKVGGERVASGMRMAATKTGLTQQVIPKTVVEYSDGKGRK